MILWKVVFDSEGKLGLVTCQIKEGVVKNIYRNLADEIVVHVFAEDAEEAIVIAKRMILNEDF